MNTKINTILNSKYPKGLKRALLQNNKQTALLNGNIELMNEYKKALDNL